MYIKVILSLVAAVTLAAGAMFVGKVDRVGGLWMLEGEYTLEMACESGCESSVPESYSFIVDFQNVDVGSFSASGYNLENSNLEWEVSGNNTGSDVAMTLRFISNNKQVLLLGSIDEQGVLSGTGTSDSEGYSWITTSGFATRESGTHGQAVKESDDKRGTAQERTGLPEKSKGNTQ